MNHLSGSLRLLWIVHLKNQKTLPEFGLQAEAVITGWPTVEKMNSYILESDNITGPWKLAVYMKDFGEQGYFLNIPSKFISKDGKSMWLCYSGNFAKDWRNIKIEEDPPGSHYGLVLQAIELLSQERFDE